jgi:hypothetical protein
MIQDIVVPSILALCVLAVVLLGMNDQDKFRFYANKQYKATGRQELADSLLGNSPETLDAPG